MRSHACIPVTPTGKKLNFPKDLINPTSQLAVLYCKAIAEEECQLYVNFHAKFYTCTIYSYRHPIDGDSFEGSSDQQEYKFMNCKIMIQLEMRYKQSIEVCHFLGLSDRVLDRSVHWLVTSSMGDWDALEIALRYEGLAPVGGMAVPLDQKCGFLYSLVF
ncbi:uncharacterized protein [Watersipora subatra]|uniref:uncharacterized protein n=1 Tax=Watersipora subatra TaxID=2589382 RepID=UPI00355B426F